MFLQKLVQVTLLRMVLISYIEKERMIILTYKILRGTSLFSLQNTVRAIKLQNIDTTYFCAMLV